jgi:hypothetical protein
MALSSHEGEINPVLESEELVDSVTLRHDAPVRRLAQDKTVLPEAALERRLRSTYSRSRVSGLASAPWSENDVAGSGAPCRHRLRTSSVASTGAGLAGFPESQAGAPIRATESASLRRMSTWQGRGIVIIGRENRVAGLDGSCKLDTPAASIYGPGSWVTSVQGHGSGGLSSAFL